MQQYTKKPVTISAIRWDGDNIQDIRLFMGGLMATVEADVATRTNRLLIPTLEGTMAAEQGDYIIRGIQGEFYPCKPDIFDATYVAAPPPPPAEMRRYIGTKIIHAKPQEQDGKPGFAVRYRDGYESWSPKEAFEEAYRLTDGMNFGLALEAVKSGEKVARRGWNGKGLWIEYQRPDQHSKMTLPYLYLNYPADAANTPGARVPWLASQTDMLSDDWEIVE